MASTRHRTFRVEVNQTAEPVTFDLQFIRKDKNGKETVEEKNFVCQPEIQGAVILDFVSSAGDDKGVETAEQIMTFLNSVLEEDSKAKFNEVTRAKDTIVSIETLTEIVGYLIEVYTDRPTQAS